MLIKNNDKNAADDHIILYYVITHSGNHTKAQDFWLELVFKIKRDTHKKKWFWAGVFLILKCWKGNSHVTFTLTHPKQDIDYNNREGPSLIGNSLFVLINLKVM